MRAPIAGACFYLLLLGMPVASACSAFQLVGSSELTGELQQSGVPAVASVLSFEDTGQYVHDNHWVQLEVEVRPADGQPFRATIRGLVITTLQAFQYQPGKLMAVRYDPRAPSRVAIDLAPPPAIAAAIGR